MSFEGVAMQLLVESEYHRIAELLKDLPMNTLFARAVVEGHVAGKVYVDDPHAPRSGYVAHPYGMSLLFGSPADENFRRALAPYLLGETVVRTSPEWLQVFPDEWSVILDAMFGSRLVRTEGNGAAAETSTPCEEQVILDTRVNFRFNRNLYETVRQSLHLPAECDIISDIEAIYSSMHGSVVPSVFWDSATDLREHGAAFALTWRGEIASTAFASFVLDDFLELGIETIERFRGKGLAVHACSALIDYCIARRLEPVWACRLSNVGSYRLAKRLGFDHLRSLPYYRLPLARRS
jgi:hypothetical protein